MPRNKTLDILRAIAVLLVVFNHVPLENSDEFSNLFFGSLKRGGWVGVDLFFVLSGFLVSGLIFEEYKRHKSFDIKRFLIRRGFKIYPIYYLFIFLSACWLLFSSREISISMILSEVLFYINYTAYIFKGPGLLWSICIEEHFYFILAFALGWMFKKKLLSIRSILLFYFFFLIIAMVSRLYNYYHYDSFVFFRDLGKSHQRFDALFFGVLLCYLYKFHALRLKAILARGHISFWLSVIGVGVNFVLPPGKFYLFTLLWASLNPIFFGTILITALHWKAPKGHLVVLFSTIGMFSYPIYLFHGHVIGAVERISIHSDYINVGLSVALSFAIGILISKTIEYPILRIRDRYFPSYSKVIIDHSAKRIQLHQKYEH